MANRWRRRARWLLASATIAAGGYGWYRSQAIEAQETPPGEIPLASSSSTGGGGFDIPVPVLPGPGPAAAPQDNRAGDAAIEEALGLLGAGDTARGPFLLRSFLRRFPAHPRRVEVQAALDRMRDSWLSEGRRLEGVEAFAEARDAYSIAILACRDRETREAIRTRLDGLVSRLIFSPRPSPGSEMYTIRPGDTLGRIAAQYGVPVECIRRVNHLSGNMIRPSERLKIVGGTRQIFVSKTDFELVVLLDGRYVASFTVGVGREGLTPEGEFVIASRIPEPSWSRSGEIIPYGDPRNILGTRWLGFQNTESLSGFGIHGSADDAGMGQEVSAGCVRMRNADVEIVYDFVPTGTHVLIVR